MDRTIVGCDEAMKAMFSLCNAINKNDLTICDLTTACRLSIKEGHEMAEICLHMMSRAVGKVKDELNPCDHKFVKYEQCEVCEKCGASRGDQSGA